jgi:hypothetical protein
MYAVFWGTITAVLIMATKTINATIAEKTNPAVIPMLLSLQELRQKLLTLYHISTQPMRRNAPGTRPSGSVREKAGKRKA